MENKISLVFPSSPFLIEQDVFPPLGILYLASALEKYGVEVECFDFGIGHKKEDVKTNVVGISLLTAQKDEGLDLIRYYKDRGHFVIVGGPHATHKALECYEAGADLAVRGYNMKSLFEVFMLTLNEDDFIFFSQFPIPNRHLLPIQSYKYKINGVPATPIMTSRSCYSNCSFCGRIPGNMELLSASRVINEIDQINKDFGFTGFMIFDDIFTTSNTRLRQIADYYVGSKYVFRCFSRTDLIKPDVCRNLKRLGVVEVGLGVESGSREILRQNTKGTTPEINEKAVRMLQDYGIRAKAFLIVGLPGENHRTVQETIDWIERVEPDDLDVSILKPMPGSAIYNDPQKFGITFDENEAYWYKGTPGKYSTTVRTEALNSDEIISYRDQMERQFKKWN